MIEFCSRRRMIAAVILLIAISVVVLFFENHLSLDNDVKSSGTAANNMPADNASHQCIESGGKIVVVTECQICKALQQKVHSHCLPTGFHETVKCAMSDPTKNREFTRSCPRMQWMEERSFWIFEGSTLVVGAASYAVVYLRQRRLDRLLIEKVHRQIAAGV